MDPQIAERLALLENEIAEVKRYTRRTYLTLVWTGIITVAAIVLPMIGLLFALPSFFSAYAGLGEGGGNTSSNAAQQSLDQLNGLESALKDLLQ